MKILDKIVTLICVSLRFFSLKKILTSLNKLQRDWKVLIAVFVFLVLIIKLLLGFFYKNKEKTILINDNNLGDVDVSLKVIENLIIRETKSIYGVKSVKASIFKHKSQSNDLISSNIVVTVDREVVISDIITEIKKNILDTVKNITGIELVDIKVSVANVSVDIQDRHLIN